MAFDAGQVHLQAAGQVREPRLDQQVLEILALHLFGLGLGTADDGRDPRDDLEIVRGRV